MNSAAVELVNKGFVPFGIAIGWDSSKKQKYFYPPQGWRSACVETWSQYFLKTHNGIAIQTGERSDLYVIDCDKLKEKDFEQGTLDGIEIFQLLENTYGALDCPVARTASGGLHYFFSLSKSLEKGLNAAKNTTKLVVTRGLLDSCNNKSITVDTRGDGGCVIAAPTFYTIDGIENKYEWIRPLVASSELKAMPEWCIRLVNESSDFPPVKKERDGIRKQSNHTTTITILDDALFIKQTQSLIEKMQNTKMLNLWGRSNGYDFKFSSIGKCACCNKNHYSHCFQVRSVVDGCFWMKSYSRKCQKQVFNWESHPLLRMVLETPTKDAPYSRMLRERYHHMGYCLVHTTKGRFLNFNGTVWEEMDKFVIAREISSVCGETMDLLVKNLKPENSITDEEKKEFEEKMALFRAGRNFLRGHSNLSGIATHYKQMYTDTEIEKQLDSNKDILAVKNGVIDLKTGVLREGRIDDYVSIQLDTVYEENGPTYLIEEIFESIFSENKPTVEYVQKLLGYAITGHIREQVWAIFTGEGSNGKSLIMGAIESLMQKWFVTASYDVFFQNDRRTNAGGPTPHIAALKGARLCVKEEAEPKSKLNTELLKMITSDNPIVGRGLYKDDESFKPTALPILLCNHKPAVDIEDEAMMRRIVVVPFHNIYTSPTDNNRPFDPQNPRHRLKDPLLAEKLQTADAQQQLLTWLVQGAMKWYKEQLGEQPKDMVDAFMNFKEENDRVKLFINAMCEVAPKGMSKKDTLKEGYFINAGLFKDKLIEHCGLKCTQKALIDRMEKKGFKYDKPSYMTEKVYVGLKFAQ